MPYLNKLETNQVNTFLQVAKNNIEELKMLTHREKATKESKFYWSFSAFDDGYIYFQMKNGGTALLWDGLGASKIGTLFKILNSKELSYAKYIIEKDSFVDTDIIKEYSYVLEESNIDYDKFKTIVAIHFLKEVEIYHEKQKENIRSNTKIYKIKKILSVISFRLKMWVKSFGSHKDELQTV